MKISCVSIYFHELFEKKFKWSHLQQQKKKKNNKNTLGINLTKEVKDLYTETKKDSHEWN